MNPRLERLLNRWLDGDLTQPEAEAVQRMLAEDPDARRACYELLMVDRLLDERVEGRSENIAMMDSIASSTVHGAKRRSFGFAPITAIAAALILTLFGTFLVTRQTHSPERRGPLITGSTDSRITIAQRQDTSHWAVGELLRLERGTADIRLNPSVSANFEGPAAIELLDSSGSIRLLEGMASFNVGAGRGAFDVLVPGGVLRNVDSRYTTEVLPDGVANVRVESGFLEIRPRGAITAVYLKSGDAVCLERDGRSQPIRLPNQHFRSGLPQQVALFRDDFRSEDGTSIGKHTPQIGRGWEILTQLNPSLIRNRKLDTSTGARRILAKLAEHEANGPRAVYIFTFHLVPPERIDDKVERQDGHESISLVDESGREFLKLFAKASNGHRWQLLDERSKAVTALTPVCALWTHSLTLCYGLDGLATLHDGATAQAPVIAEIRLADPPAASGFLLDNRSGGDLALSGVEATLLPAPVIDPK